MAIELPQSVTGEYLKCYRGAGRKEKTRLPDEFTRLAGYHRKRAAGSEQETGKEVVVYLKGGAVKIKPEKKRPANRKGGRICADDVAAALRPVREFFRWKRGKIPTPPMRQQTGYIAGRPAFGITPAGALSRPSAFSC